MLRRQKQLAFKDSSFIKPNDSFGGAMLKGNPRSARPIDSKLPVFLTLRSGKSVLRLPKTFATVERLIDQTARKYGVKIFKRANVGNHLHLVLQINPKLWAKFIRELTGRIAQMVNELIATKSSRAESNSGGFWMFRPHTRIIRSWRKAFQSVLEYIGLNQLEAEGHIDRREISSLKQLRLIWADG